jgi:hypothetical protein
MVVVSVAACARIMSCASASIIHRRPRNQSLKLLRHSLPPQHRVTMRRARCQPKISRTIRYISAKSVSVRQSRSCSSTLTRDRLTFGYATRSSLELIHTHKIIAGLVH